MLLMNDVAQVVTMHISWNFIVYDTVHFPILRVN